MKVAVGSKNPVKIGAARDVLSQFFTNIEVSGIEVDPKVSRQPFGMEESVEGAIARAEQVLAHGDFGVGIESGLVAVPHTMTGYLDIHFCAITDGIATTIGAGPGFEYPSFVVEEVKKGRTIEEVMEDIIGIKDIGRKDGAVGFLSNGRLTRVELAKQAVLSAMIPRMWMEDG
ncbi:MAG: inosine/xanthosine triphosphatase [Candidatus Hydrothermarchaeales archaeon]